MGKHGAGSIRTHWAAWTGVLGHSLLWGQWSPQLCCPGILWPPPNWANVARPGL